jgi:hypothetical protein
MMHCQEMVLASVRRASLVVSATDHHSLVCIETIVFLIFKKL